MPYAYTCQLESVASGTITRKGPASCFDSMRYLHRAHSAAVLMRCPVCTECTGSGVQACACVCVRVRVRVWLCEVYAMSAMVWMVLPSPISSARMPLRPLLCSETSQRSPAIWYSLSEPPLSIAGCVTIASDTVCASL